MARLSERPNLCREDDLPQFAIRLRAGGWSIDVFSGDEAPLPSTTITIHLWN